MKHFEKKNWSENRMSEKTKEMFKATCSDCGKLCEVPFRPNGKKPVYCANCFSAKRDDGDRTPRKEFGARPPFRTEFKQNTFRQPAAPVADDSKKELKEISIKLDRLLNAIELMMSPKVEPKKEFSPKKSTPKKKDSVKKKYKK